ncbi:hypothetical protein CI105_00955 [Candidatus Izimaplasma bacterium ZiA1]|uniref:sensor histidine kinase n=1 Tax=Candidatus Izimoplasma sp. ZiA1 TaxID=2024899 RepID=UPI000BAA5D2C|nr:hypothetical protein CI105_00955 [Candidatus Izimaplasma bacterium ZiA1]
MVYVNEMNSSDTGNYYDEMYAFTTMNNAYSVTMSGDFRIIESSYTNYFLTITDDATDNVYNIIVPNDSYEFNINEKYDLIISTYNDEFYQAKAMSLEGDSTALFSETCTSGCITFTGEISSIQKPSNINYLFKDNLIIKQEVSKLSLNLIDIGNHSYEEGYWYKSDSGNIQTIVFIHELNTWDYMMTVVPIEDPNEIISIVSAYNNYVYLTAVAIVLLWSFRLSSVISKPIQNIEAVTKEIANLNFEVEAHEYNNKENESLSKSINLISRNLKETLDTISTKNEELVSLYNEQSTQYSLKKQLVSSISHELKTPLMIMQVTIQGILDGVVKPEETQNELNNVITEINKSSIMIQDLLQIYRLDDASTKLDIGEFNLSEVVKYFIDDFDSIISKYKFNLELLIDDDVYVEGDMKLIKRVISNFITNAVKYTPEKEKISVIVKNNEDEVIFEIRNYGTSIDEKLLKNIWMPFFRVEHQESSRLKTKGTGIGLFLVSEILKAHEFDFGIENIENGISAYFVIPKK